MKIPSKHGLLIVVERGDACEFWAVIPAADRVHLVAVNEDGATLPFGYVENDCTIGGERFRFVQQLPDKEFVAVPWTEAMDES
jgi:hypothetical protein